MYIPDPRWEEPSLLIPGKKPVGPVVDTGASDAVFLFPDGFATLDGTPPDSTNNVSKGPYYASFNGTDSRISYPDRFLLANSNFTVVAKFRKNSDHFGYVFSQTEDLVNGDSGAIIGIYVIKSADVPIFAIRGNSNSGTTGVSGGVECAIGEWVTVVARRNGDEAAIFDKTGKTTGAITFSTSNVNTFSIGSRRYENAWGTIFDGDIEFVREIKSALPDGLCHSIVRNPYQFLIPA